MVASAHLLGIGEGKTVHNFLKKYCCFRADLNGTQFWSAAENTCEIPGCTAAEITITIPVTITVANHTCQPYAGLNVYAFDGDTYTGYHATTDSNGEVAFTLPQGEYRFRFDLNGTQFWSAAENTPPYGDTCEIPGCTAAEITITLPVTVTVANHTGQPYAGLSVYAFNGDTYTGYHGVTDDLGLVTLTLPEGSYRFRADYDGVQFWSGQENHCDIPGCLTAEIILPGSLVETNVTIDYTYDGLYRLTAADYSDGAYFQYTYDPVGNRLTQETQEETNAYVYDIANRLVEVDGASYLWDDNGNLLFDGESFYNYDYANRLTSVNGAETNAGFAYNGLGDRLQQTVDGATMTYTLDLNTGLTQVLTDGDTTYLYGLARLSQESDGYSEYYLGDALGSVRQLTEGSGALTYAATYTPYGEVLTSGGDGKSVYGFTNEYTSQGLVYLRARYYNPYLNQFTQPDTIVPNPYQPADWNRYAYVRNNPINYTDPSGQCPRGVCSSQEYNPRNLTSWLYNEMIANANSVDVRHLRTMNELAVALANDVLCDLGQAVIDAMLKSKSVSEAIKNVIVARKGTIFSIAYLHGEALYKYSQLVKDGAVWDFKDEIGIRLGPGVSMCANGTCFDDIEYSVVGNIHFAYIGIAAGIPGWEIQAGAGFAEITDPAHDPDNQQYTGSYIPPAFWQIVGWTPWNLSTINFGDEPKDHEAVTCGIRMGRYGVSMTRFQFESELARCIGRLARHDPDPLPVRADIARDWPYPTGYFNNIGNVYIPREP